jgi:hypothetical protein
MTSYDVDACRQDDYLGLAESFQTIRELLQQTADERQDMRLVVFLPMLQKALEAARYVVEELKDVLGCASKFTERHATSPEEDDLDQDSDTEG